MSTPVIVIDEEVVHVAVAPACELTGEIEAVAPGGTP
jgi:hypothetical protein